MRIAFPTNNQKTIASHIGLAKGFLIVDTESSEKFYIQNPVLQKINEERIDLKNTEESHRGLGTGRVIPTILREVGVDILVARDFGEGMIRNLAREGIKAVESEIKDIEEFLKEDEMKEVTFNENEFGYGRGLGYGRGIRRAGRGYGRRCQRNDYEHRKGLGRGRGLGYGKRWENL